ncbi:MAG: YebC/PmpR family DNA-binding transcriptional regulator [Candidatus Margulisbacteria bacterium]|nr:YebC/PmpR family DNA-binding transcriptional regulator [Candidatus Margulisiibacteriota bacterium]MBU1021119.1 YebC/PmpR family DNA-binding transcriptional regulator [Candidatus Margulisiibacteriota bacterium]MBU1728674.1 YebC/PmpR family DNA-binding transcriptional regulator [Candidatus Margulisiibacteriota bacterium]MBU1955125.1 YebC/PmpR family DNA-binding transcriptional regulator [Candidatus Margulisiibacteriota bacterium]
MSGHSKWATIKRKKGKTDAQRGKIFTKLIRELITATKEGGPDPTGNSRLRMAIEKAKESNLPNDKIKRAIERVAGGEADEDQIEEVVYEGYGPGGVAILVETLTDNKNRTVSEVRNVFTKHGGNMGSSGCVAWNFEKKGLIVYDKKGKNDEAISLAAVEAGAEDVNTDEEVIEVTTTPENFHQVRQSLIDVGHKPDSSEITMNAKTTVKLEGEDAHKVLKLVSLLEDLDDVQKVHANFDISKEILEEESKQ